MFTWQRTPRPRHPPIARQHDDFQAKPLGHGEQLQELLLLVNTSQFTITMYSVDRACVFFFWVRERPAQCRKHFSFRWQGRSVATLVAPHQNSGALLQSMISFEHIEVVSNEALVHNVQVFDAMGHHFHDALCSSRGKFVGGSSFFTQQWPRSDSDDLCLLPASRCCSCRFHQATLYPPDLLPDMVPEMETRLPETVSEVRGLVCPNLCTIEFRMTICS